MTVLQRFGYYLGGFAVGLIILAFFLSGKKTSCAYGPNARVLKNISTKERSYSENVQQLLNNQSIDTLTISNILKYGRVNFSKSNTKLDSCKIYNIEASLNNINLLTTLINMGYWYIDMSDEL